MSSRGSLLAKGLGARNLGLDTITVFSLWGLAEPVIPIGFGPFRSNLPPEISRDEPAQAGEKVGAPQGSGIADSRRRSVVIKGADTKEGGVLAEDGQCCGKVLIEIRSDLEIVLQDDDGIVGILSEESLERPIIVLRDVPVGRRPDVGRRKGSIDMLKDCQVRRIL